MRFACWTGQKDVLMQRRGYWMEILVWIQTCSSSNCLVLIKPTAPPARSSFYFLNVLQDGKSDLKMSKKKERSIIKSNHMLNI